MKTSKSKDYNPNYLAKIVEITKSNIRKHSNADRLQIVTVDFQDVIVGNNAKPGDLYVYFPVECKINPEFIKDINGFRDKSMNHNNEVSGFFESNCRVRAVRLRGEKSFGFMVPAIQLFGWALNVSMSIYDVKDQVTIGDEFDTINGIKVLEKYIIPVKQSQAERRGKKPTVSRLIDGQIHLHVDTENLRRNSHKISPLDVVSVTYKTHGTSWWVSNVPVKRNIPFVERVLRLLGVNILEEEYDYVYGSRRVVKNKSMDDPKAKDHFFGYDLWRDVMKEVRSSIPKGFTVYGECLGYTKDGSAIQKGYDYGCPVGDWKLEVYRVTFTSRDGVVNELSWGQIKEFCSKFGLTHSHEFYYGLACDMYPDLESGDQWSESFIKRLERDYNDKDCFMCINDVPEEGIVVRKDKAYEFEAYKLKSFSFLEHETKQLDQGQENIEDNA